MQVFDFVEEINSSFVFNDLAREVHPLGGAGGADGFFGAFRKMV